MSDDPAAMRDLIPALDEVTYLDTATAAPGTAPVVSALRRAQAEWESGRFSWRAWEAEAEATRESFARLIGGAPAEVALISSVAEAAATVAASLPIGRIVVGSNEFRSNLFAWLALRQRGFEVVEVPADQGAVRGEQLALAITPGTALVAVSLVQSSNGFRIDLEPIARRCRQTGTRLFVNATQSLGALRLDAARIGADYVAAHGYKWLLAPRGAAWLWARPDRLASLQPLAPSWKSAADPFDDYYGSPMDLSPAARRLDASLSWFAWAGARAALDLIAAQDPVRLEARCLELAGALRRESAALGFEVAPAEAPTQIVAVRVTDPLELKRRLQAGKVIAAVRGGWLRMGCHAYNNEADLAVALAVMGRP